MSGAPPATAWAVRSDRNLRLAIAGIWAGFALFFAGTAAAAAWALGLL
jgi:hypothetical protein